VKGSRRFVIAIAVVALLVAAAVSVTAWVRWRIAKKDRIERLEWWTKVLSDIVARWEGWVREKPSPESEYIWARTREGLHYLEGRQAVDVPYLVTCLWLQSNGEGPFPEYPWLLSLLWIEDGFDVVELELRSGDSHSKIIPLFDWANDPVWFREAMRSPMLKELRFPGRVGPAFSAVWDARPGSVTITLADEVLQEQYQARLLTDDGRKSNWCPLYVDKESPNGTGTPR